MQTPDQTPSTPPKRPPVAQPEPVDTDLEVCEKCWKDKRLCLCKQIKPAKTRLQVLVLQHPREAANPFGTARLLTLGLGKSTHRIGLSWRSLSDALGLPKNAAKPEPKKWAVLFVGTRAEAKRMARSPGLTITHKDENPAKLGDLKGIVILDGNWKQAKTLWWRNAWLLKLNRLLLDTDRPSLYGKLRRQPRKGCLSSLEAAAETLTKLGEPESVNVHLTQIFQKFLDRIDEVTSNPSEVSPEVSPEVSEHASPASNPSPESFSAEV